MVAPGAPKIRERAPPNRPPVCSVALRKYWSRRRARMPVRDIIQRSRQWCRRFERKGHGPRLALPPASGSGSRMTRRSCVRELVADFSIEVTPATAGKHATLADLLPAQTRVYIAFVPGEDHAQRRGGGARPRRGPRPGASFSGALDPRSRPARRLSAARRRRGRGRRGAPDRRRHRSAPRPLPGPLPCSRPECSRRAASAPSGSPGTLKASVRWLRQPR